MQQIPTHCKAKSESGSAGMHAVKVGLLGWGLGRVRGGGVVGLEGGRRGRFWQVIGD